MYRTHSAGAYTMAVPGSAASPRFAGILARHNRRRPIYDTILIEEGDCVVTPTLGSIVPHWLLIIPRRPSAHFAEWNSATGRNPVGVVADVLGQLKRDSKSAIWFEHGAAHTGSVVGCGVDYAHLHLLIDPPFSFEQFERAARQAAPLRWQSTSSEHAYGNLSKQSSYLLAGCGDICVRSMNVDAVGSQFFRRVVASLADCPTSWDYKAYPHLDNVARTVEKFAA